MAKIRAIYPEAFISGGNVVTVAGYETLTKTGMHTTIKLGIGAIGEE